MGRNITWLLKFHFFNVFNSDQVWMATPDKALDSFVTSPRALNFFFEVDLGVKRKWVHGHSLKVEKEVKLYVSSQNKKLNQAISREALLF